MQIKQGRYKTRDGHTAKVSKLKSVGPEWYFEGAVQVEAEKGELWVMHRWWLNGMSLTERDIDIIPEEEVAS